MCHHYVDDELRVRETLGEETDEDDPIDERDVELEGRDDAEPEPPAESDAPEPAADD